MKYLQKSKCLINSVFKLVKFKMCVDFDSQNSPVSNAKFKNTNMIITLISYKPRGQWNSVASVYRKLHVSYS